MGRVAEQQGGANEFYLGDALGSARQVADDGGSVTLARAYSPYGESAYSSGTAQTDYGFTGEFTDPSGLIHLRARYYAPGDGRFISRDSWDGDYNRPLSLNRWNYVEGNPINFTDPLGLIKQNDATDANAIVEDLRNMYNVRIEKDWGYRSIPVPPSSLPPGIMTGNPYFSCEWKEGNWRNLDELELTLKGVEKMATKLGGTNKFRSALAGIPITFRRMPNDRYSDGSVAWTVLDIKFYNDTFIYGDLFASGTVVHELAHVWDTRQTPPFSLSSGMSQKTKSHRFICPSLWSLTCPYKYDPSGLEDPPTSYGTMDGARGEREDFADSFTICVHPLFKGVSSLDKYPIRKAYIEGLLNGNKCSR